MEHDKAITTAGPVAWNRGKLLGQKLPFKLKEIRAIRIRLQIGEQAEQLALFKLAIDSTGGVHASLIELPLRPQRCSRWAISGWRNSDSIAPVILTTN